MISNQQTQQFYGRIHFFFQHRISINNFYALAYIETWKVIETRYRYKLLDASRGNKTTKYEFIPVGAIDCLVGIVSSRDEFWVIDRLHGKGSTYELVVDDIV